MSSQGLELDVEVVLGCRQEVARLLIRSEFGGPLDHETSACERVAPSFPRMPGYAERVLAQPRFLMCVEGVENRQDTVVLTKIYAFRSPEDHNPQV